MFTFFQHKFFEVYLGWMPIKTQRKYWKVTISGGFPVQQKGMWNFEIKWFVSFVILYLLYFWIFFFVNQFKFIYIYIYINYINILLFQCYKLAGLYCFGYYLKKIFSFGLDDVHKIDEKYFMSLFIAGNEDIEKIVWTNVWIFVVLWGKIMT